MNSIDPVLAGQFRGKRFLFVIGQYDKLGGAERQAMILAEQLQKLVDCRVEFLAWSGEGRVSEEIQSMGLRAHLFPLNWKRGSIRRLLTLQRLASYVRQEIQPHYLLPYIGFNCKIMAMIWKKCGAKFTWWNQRDEGRGIYGSRMEHRALRSVSGIVSNSFEGRDFLVKTFGLTPDDITVINNGIVLPNQEHSGDWRSKFGIDSNDLLITMIANLTQFKDHETLIRAFAELRKTEIGKRCHLCLAGRFGDTATRLKVLGFDLNLSDCLHFPGVSDNVDELWRATDLGVHSSVKEGCPNAALEAMSHGLCVAGTDISGMRQALGNETAAVSLSPPGDWQALSKVMLLLLKDDTLRRQLGKKNRDRVAKHFSPAGLTNQVLDYINTWMSRT